MSATKSLELLRSIRKPCLATEEMITDAIMENLPIISRHPLDYLGLLFGKRTFVYDKGFENLQHYLQSDIVVQKTGFYLITERKTMTE